MDFLTLAGLAFVGSIVAVGIAEGAAAVAGTEAGMNPFVVGIVCASSQLVVHVLLYHFGEWLVSRWVWLQRSAQKTRKRFEKHLAGGYLSLSGCGAFVGTPPLIAMLVLAPSFSVRMMPLVVIAFIGRTARFTLIAYAGGTLWDLVT